MAPHQNRRVRRPEALTHQIKIAKTLQINPFNVATNGALTEVHGHPGLEVIDAPRLDVWMGVQEVIQTVSKRVTQRS